MVPATVVAVLEKRLVYNASIWSFSLEHGDLPRMLVWINTEESVRHQFSRLLV